MRTVGAGRWLLLLALAAGLVGMHHLEPASPAGPTMTAGSMTAMADDGPGHPAGVPGAVPVAAGWAPSMDMAMHPCLAVLVALGLLGLLVLAVAAPVRRPPTGWPRAAVRATARPPPRTAVRLALLCVLRN